MFSNDFLKNNFKKYLDKQILQVNNKKYLKIKKPTKNKIRKNKLFNMSYIINETDKITLIKNNDWLIDELNIIEPTIEYPLVLGIDFNNNGRDDFTDFVVGARKQTRLNPKYDGTKVYEGGYPPDGEGVCTDLIWKAFKEAGYSLKDMMDYDIKYNNEFYSGTHLYGPNPDIDFRRVRNQAVFFNRYAKSLTLDPFKLSKWLPGDIVIFGDDSHIAIISDKRNEHGIPYILHTSDVITGEEDGLLRRHTNERGPITGHYRFIYNERLKVFKWKNTV